MGKAKPTMYRAGYYAGDLGKQIWSRSFQVTDKHHHGTQAYQKIIDAAVNDLIVEVASVYKKAKKTAPSDDVIRQNATGESYT